MEAGDGTVGLGALNLRQDYIGFDSSPDDSVSSPVMRQKAAITKQYIDNHHFVSSPLHSLAQLFEAFVIQMTTVSK